MLSFWKFCADESGAALIEYTTFAWHIGGRRAACDHSGGHLGYGDLANSVGSAAAIGTTPSAGFA
jgi:hypothetical protein